MTFHKFLKEEREKKHALTVSACVLVTMTPAPWHGKEHGINKCIVTGNMTTIHIWFELPNGMNVNNLCDI